jgi:MFS family permease
MGTLSFDQGLQQPTRVRFGVLGFACSLSLLTYLDRVCIMPVKEDIQNDLGLDNPAMGLVFSAFILGYALFEVPSGWMGDVWGSRRVLARIVLCWSLFTALTGCVWRFTLDSGYRLPLGSHGVPLLLDGLVVLLLVRFLFGVGEAGAYPNLTRVVSAWFPFRERGRAQGLIWMSARVGGAFAPFVLGRLAAALGWRRAFWVLGLAGLCWVVLFYSWFRDSPDDKPGCNDAERDLIRADAPARAGTHGGHPWPPWRGLLLSPTAWALCLASFCVCFGWYFYPTWQPEYLKDVFGIRYADSEILTGLPFLCGAVGSFVGGRLSDSLVRATGSCRWGRSLVGVVGFSGAGLCVLGTGFVAHPWQAVALLCLAFLINDLAIPVIWAASGDVGGRFAGTVAGIMNTAGGVGGLLSPVLIPRVLAWLPPDYAAPQRWRIIFAGLALSWFVGAAAWLFIDAGKPLFDEPSGA